MKKMTAMLLALLCLSACGAPKQETTKTAEQPEQTTADTVQEQPKSEPVPVPEPEPEPEPALPLDGKIICVDPGHEVTGLRVQEPISPASSATKEAFVGGAAGRNQTEEQLNLAVGLRLQSLLIEQGATVIMTRTTH